jgi:hypothetical protein
MNYSFHPEAENEFTETIEYYEDYDVITHKELVKATSFSVFPLHMVRRREAILFCEVDSSSQAV